jgi:hypothetical protein
MSNGNEECSEDGGWEGVDGADSPILQMRDALNADLGDVVDVEKYICYGREAEEES